MPLSTPPAHLVRVVVPPGTDVLLEPGARLGDARARLAHLTGRPELAASPLLVDGRPVDDEQRCGTHPLLPGATVDAVPRSAARDTPARSARPGSGTTPLAAVVAAPWHVAVVAGPDAGRLEPLAGVPHGRCHVDDLRIRWSTHRGTVRVRVAGPRGTRRRRTGRRARAVRVPWAVRWRPGTELTSGPTTYALRPRPAVRPGPPADARTVLADPPAPRGPGASLPLLLTPALGSVALAVALGNPVYALVALLGPLSLGIGSVARARARRRARRDAPDGTTAPDRPDPLDPRPADVATRAVVAHLASDGPPPSVPRSALRDDEPSPTVRTLPDGCAAVVGAGPAALATARAVLAELLVDGAVPQVRCAPPRAGDWAWCRWIPGARIVASLYPDPGTASAHGHDSRPGVLVVDLRPGPGTATAAELAAAWAHRHQETRFLLVAARTDDVPAWCRTVLHAGAAGVRRTDATGAHAPGPPVGVRATWADDVARHLAAAHHQGRLLPAPRSDDACDPAAPSLPADVGLADLLDAPARDLPSWVGARWRARHDARSLDAPIGVGADGNPVTLDLVAHGPHLLVAGTTGSGKSELLQGIVAGLALTHPPTHLVFALVDFKGGTSFGACADLPHVAGRVSDLDPGLAGRALAGLRAELHRRERVLTGAGVGDVVDLPVGTLPRLVVVIDEFRALADDLPDFLPGLLRVAAQGRSLGVHLVLATQRPAGAVSADVRANVSARVALRVVGPSDSLDIVDSRAASTIPASVPGRAVLRLGTRPPVALQCARAGGPARGEPQSARLAPAWGAGPGAAGREPPAEPHVDVLGELVAAAREVARRDGSPAPAPPWLPPLPDRVELADLADVADVADVADPAGRRDRPGGGVPADRTPALHGLPLALGDLPAQQSRVVVRWDPADGHLGVVGRARSGRTTTLHTLACAALDAGWHVHVVGGDHDPLAALAGSPGVGTVVERSDARRVARLLRLLSGHDDGQDRPAAAAPGASAHPTLLLVDDVEAVHAALAQLPGGVGTDALAAVLDGSPGAQGVHVAVAGSGHRLAGLDARVGVRLVLSTRDRHVDVALGVPGAHAGLGGPPGRAVRTGAGEPVACQVAVAGAGRSRSGPGTADPEHGRPLRLRPLPRLVRAEDLPAADVPDDDLTTGHAVTTGPGTAGRTGPVGRLRVPLGLGGDDAAALHLDLHDGALVTGPPGSGRTTTLRLLAAGLAARGALAGVVARDGVLNGLAGDLPTARRTVPADLTAFLDAVAAGLERRPGGAVPHVVVVDDLDRLAQVCVLEAERLAALTRDGLRLLASALTSVAATTARGPVAELRASRTGVVLGPAERGSSEVFGARLAWFADPGRPLPGRGVVVQGSRLAPVQVALPGFSPQRARRASSPRPRVGA